MGGGERGGVGGGEKGGVGGGERGGVGEGEAMRGRVEMCVVTVM